MSRKARDARHAVRAQAEAGAHPQPVLVGSQASRLALEQEGLLRVAAACSGYSPAASRELDWTPPLRQASEQ